MRIDGMTPEQQRAAAALIATTEQHLRETLKRPPDPVEVIVGARAAAWLAVSSATQRPRPAGLPSCAAGMAEPDALPAIAADEISKAEATVAFIDAVEFSPSKVDDRQAHARVDAVIMQSLTADWINDRAPNDSQAARRVNKKLRPISRVQARSRKIARCGRIMAALRSEYPELFPVPRRRCRGRTAGNEIESVLEITQ